MSSALPVGAIAPDMIDDLVAPAAATVTRSAATSTAAAAATPAPGASFGQLFTQGLAQVNESLLASQVELQKLATGEAPNLHQVMVRLEESRTSFQLLLQVRGRLLEAYQDVMRMQI